MNKESINDGVAYNSNSYQNYLLNNLISEAIVCSLTPNPNNLQRWLYVLQAIDRTILPKLSQEQIKIIQKVRIDHLDNPKLANAIQINRERLIKYENCLRHVATQKKMLITDNQEISVNGVI